MHVRFVPFTIIVSHGRGSLAASCLHLRAVG
jgi:hypothetical protein